MIRRRLVRYGFVGIVAILGACGEVLAVNDDGSSTPSTANDARAEGSAPPLGASADGAVDGVAAEQDASHGSGPTNCGVGEQLLFRDDFSAERGWRSGFGSGGACFFDGGALHAARSSYLGILCEPDAGPPALGITTLRVEMDVSFDPNPSKIQFMFLQLQSTVEPPQALIRLLVNSSDEIILQKADKDGLGQLPNTNTIAAPLGTTAHVIVSLDMSPDRNILVRVGEKEIRGKHHPVVMDATLLVRFGTFSDPGNQPNAEVITRFDNLIACATRQ